MKRNVKKCLFDALRACEATQSFISGKRFVDYEQDLLLRSAVERQLEIIGEALNRASTLQPDLVLAIPDIPRIVGFRNRIIHGYDSVDDELVWDVVKTKIPVLKEQVKASFESE